MNSYDKAASVAGRGIALALFTRGWNFRVKKKGAGSTGNWKLDPKRARSAKWVVVYVHGKDGGAVWRAKNAGVSQRRGRWQVQLQNLRLVGHTDESWRTFAGGQNPVRYVKG